MSTPSPAAPLPELVTATELAARLGVPRTTLAHWLHHGTWLPRPAGTVGRALVWRAADLEGVEALVAGRPRRGRPRSAARLAREAAAGAVQSA